MQALIGLITVAALTFGGWNLAIAPLFNTETANVFEALGLSFIVFLVLLVLVAAGRATDVTNNFTGS